MSALSRASFLLASRHVHPHPDLFIPTTDLTCYRICKAIIPWQGAIYEVAQDCCKKLYMTNKVTHFSIRRLGTRV